jgi:hypothetical protein
LPQACCFSITCYGSNFGWEGEVFLAIACFQ